MRKFEIIDVKESPGSPGPDRLWKIFYKAIVDKKWVSSELWIIARNSKQAKERALNRFGGKE
jgi:hypothetical protein